MIKKFKVHFILKFTEKNVDRAHKKKMRKSGKNISKMKIGAFDIFILFTQ